MSSWLNTMIEVDALLLALDAATSDAERAAVVAATSSAVLDQLHAALTYRAFIAATDRELAADEAARAAFTRSLQDAPTDAARLAIIRSTPPAFVAEWSWVQRATPERWQKRYLQLIYFGDAR